MLEKKNVTFSRSERFSFPHPFPFVTFELCTNLPARRNRTLDLCTTLKRLCMSLYVFAAVFLTASTWHRAKFVVQLCHGEFPMFF